MKYGFIIDNRKCIGCHACTTACKSEHEVPLGVFRTWVKQVEKGTFPNTRRVFAVHRCNHCTDAPCVEICPVTALFIRNDGIVDFDNRRCIGCKSCMQACPYDALFIDPNSHTAAKCNYCAHRVDIGLEPACVVVCPEHAIVSGDMDDPRTEISRLLAREQTNVRKPEKATVPNLFYIDGDAYALTPTAAERPDGNLWSAQTRGVGHYAKYTEQLAWQGDNLVAELLQKSGNASGYTKDLEVLGGTDAKRVYGIPDKGILWGWEVPAYVSTKAVAAGAYLLPAVAGFFSENAGSDAHLTWGAAVSLVFLLLTTGLLVKDLDRPDRFLNVLFRPQWRSWLVRGGYALSLFGGLLSLQILSAILGWTGLFRALAIPGVLLALIVAVYTAFLFAQARGRDFWQSPLLPVHMVVHAGIAGGGVFAMLDTLGIIRSGSLPANVLVGSLLANLLVLALELGMPHPTSDAKIAAKMITKGRYKDLFRWGTLVIGNLLPLVLILTPGIPERMILSASVLALAGIYITEKIWVEAPQRIPLA